MRTLLALNLDGGVAILFTILAILAFSGLSVLMFFVIRRERARFGEVHSKMVFLQKEKLIELIKNIISNRTVKVFNLFQVEISDYENLRRTFGQVQYDTMINSICVQLKNQLPAGSRFALIRPDCMLVYMRGNTGFDVEMWAKSFIDTIRRKVKLTDVLSAELECNVGIISYPASGTTFEELTDNLDVAIVVAKRMGVNTFTIYSMQLGNTETEEYKYYKEIKAAMTNREFTLYYQPIVNVVTNEVFGAEGLMRWNHKTQGIISPAHFLHIMEQSGDIYWVGLWTFEQLLRQHAEWNSQREQRFYCSVNLSIKQLLSSKLIGDMKRVIKKCNANPKDYCFEILELTMCEASNIAMENIRGLIEMGFGIAIDRFGRDVESPGILETFPATHIKFDKQFLLRSQTSNMTRGMVNTILEHAKEKNITCIADNIEKSEELDYVKSLGIKYVQGYYFSPPKDKGNFIADVTFTPWTNPEREIPVYVPPPTKSPRQQALEEFNSETENVTEEEDSKKGKEKGKEKAEKVKADKTKGKDKDKNKEKSSRGDGKTDPKESEKSGSDNIEKKSETITEQDNASANEQSKEDAAANPEAAQAEKRS